MQRGLRLGILVLVLLAVPAQGKPADGPADRALADSKEAVDDVVDGLGDAGKAVGDAVGDAGKGLGDAAGAVGRSVGRILAAVGSAAAAAAGAAGAFGLLAAARVADLLLATGRATGELLAAVGRGAGLVVVGSATSLISAALWLGSSIAAFASATLAALDVLRPEAMPEPAFRAAAAVGAATATAAAGWSLASLLRKAGWLGLGMAGFSRIASDELLDHPLRAQVFQAIQQRPGTHASELARTMGVGWGTMTHHLDKLERAGLVATRRVNNQKCYFEQGGRVSRSDMAVASAVRSERAGEIAAYVATHPMTSQKAMAASIGVSPALASFHVRKLVNLGVLEKMRRGKETLLTTTDTLRRVMAGGEAAVSAPAAFEATLAARS